MIVSHRHRFIFFAVPKTATHALRQALEPHLGDEDWQQQSLYGKDESPIAALAAVGHGHLSVRDLLSHFSGEAWHGYFKFAFVRDPFDRFVSICSFLFRDDRRFTKAATAMMKGALARPRFRNRVLVRPQIELLAGPDGNPAMDFVGRFESLQDSADEAFRRIGLPRTKLVRRNPSRRGHFVDYYDGELADAVRDFYRADFDSFGYPGELPSSTN